MNEKIVLSQEKKTDFLEDRCFGKMIIKGSRYLEVILKLKTWRKPACAIQKRSNSLGVFCKSLEKPYHLYAVVLN